MKIIAFSGKRGSGKSTCANYLAQRYGATRISFADQLRRELVALGYPRGLVHQKPTAEPMRRLLVAHGCARRWIEPDYWVDHTLKEITRCESDLVVIDDLRFRNEAERLVQVGAHLVRVAKVAPLYREGFIAGVDDDPSETDLDSWINWTRVITAGPGQLGSLYAACDVLADRLGILA